MKAAFLFSFLTMASLLGQTTSSECELYYSQRCSPCRRVVEYITGNQLRVRLKDISTNTDFKQQLLDKTGQTWVPCLIAQDEPIYGEKPIINWLKTHESEVSHRP